MSLNVNFHGDFPIYPSFRGLVNTPDGKVLACPYGSGFGVQKIDPTNWSFTDLSTAGFYETGAGKTGWLSCALAPNGKVLCNTWTQPNLMVVDTNNWSISTVNSTYSQQRATCLGHDGNWWSVPWAGYNVYKMNPNTLVRESPSIKYVPHSHPNNPPTDPTWGYINTTSAYSRYWGIVPGPGTLMFGIPFAAERVIVVNPYANGNVSDPIAYQAQGPNGLINGGYVNSVTGTPWHDYNNNLWPLGSNGPAWARYSGGTLCPISGKIICMPRRAHSILIIDPALAPAFGQDCPVGFIKELPLEIGPGKLSDTTSNYFGSAHLADGRIISVPFGNNSVVIWDGRTETVTFYEIPELDQTNGAAIDSVGIDLNWYASGLLMPNGKTLFSPYGANKFMTIDVGQNKELTQASVMQRWVNRSL